VEGQIVPTRSGRVKPAHLICGIPLWGLAGTLACGYLARLSYLHVQHGHYQWRHDGWTIVTYGVWVLLLAGLMIETRCWPERVFFGLVGLNFIVGFVMAVWANFSPRAGMQAREVACVVWALAAVVSLALVFRSGRASVREKSAR